MNIKSLKTDEHMTKIILDNTNIFSNVHPNVITVFGGLLIFPIVNAIKEKNFKMLLTLLVVRWLADNLDGGIARKYKKTSKMGETLDTLSDSVFALASGYYFTRIYDIDIKYYYAVVCIGIWLMIYRYDMFNDKEKDTHQKLKEYDGSNPFDILLRINTNNTWIIIAIFAYLIYRKKDSYII